MVYLIKYNECDNVNIDESYRELQDLTNTYEILLNNLNSLIN